MQALRAGSVGWLLTHEVRVTWRSMALSPLAQLGGIGLMLVYFSLGGWIAWTLTERIESSDYFSVLIFISAAAAFTFNISGAMRAAQQTLYEQGDLELLLSSPTSPPRIIMAKLANISVSMVFWNAAFLFPLLIPIAAINNPQLFGLLALTLSVSVIATCIGLGLALFVVHLVGPQRARRMIQIFAAFIGAAIFVSSQAVPYFGGGEQSLYKWCLAHGIGISGFTGLAGRAGFGELKALLMVLAAAAALFLLTAWSLQKQFIKVYQSASQAQISKPSKGTDIKSLFGNHPGRMIVAKDAKLLFRDPALIYNMLLQLIFMAPLMAGFGKATSLLSLMPGAAFMSVFSAAKLVGDITGLAINAEDAPDLLRVSPQPHGFVMRWKLYGVMLISVPLIVIIPLAMMVKSFPAAALTLVLTILAAVLATVIELKFSKPRPRLKFARRGSGSVMAYFLGLVMSVVLGGLAAYLVSLISPLSPAI
jgi:ABC-2 type transport system permease protein